jgi:hypothetical protein
MACASTSSFVAPTDGGSPDATAVDGGSPDATTADASGTGDAAPADSSASDATGFDATPEAGHDFDAASFGPLAPKSGTRILVRSWLSDDGFLRFEGLFDTHLNTGCELDTADDGKTRCIAYDALFTGVFSDMNCTARVVQSETCGSTAYVRESVSGAPACSTAVTVAQAGAKVTGEVFQLAGSNCTSAGVAGAPGGVDYVSLGAAVAASTFVEFTEQKVSLATGVETSVFVGSDGARFWQGELRDTTHGDVVANIVEATDKTMRVVPLVFPEPQAFFADSACSTPLATLPVNNCSATPTIWARTETDVCDTFQHVYPVGAAHAAPPFAPQGAACVAGHPLPNVALFDVGPELPPSDFVEAVPIMAGGTRLAAQTYTIGGQPLLGHQNAVDQVTGELCYFEAASDGMVRCLPARPAEALYTDPNCATPPIFGQYVGDPCAPRTKFGEVVEGFPCQITKRIYQLGAQITPAPATTYAKIPNDGTCKPVMRSNYQYNQGTEMPAAMFARATLAY